MHGAKPDFRIRSGDRIVGYQRTIEGRAWVSPDGLWWRGASSGLDSDDDLPRNLDMNTGWKDKTNRWVFVQDVLEIQWKNPLRRKWTAHVETSADGIVLLNVDGKRVALEELVFAKAFAVVGHAWLA